MSILEPQLCYMIFLSYHIIVSRKSNGLTITPPTSYCFTCCPSENMIKQAAYIFMHVAESDSLWPCTGLVYRIRDRWKVETMKVNTAYRPFEGPALRQIKLFVSFVFPQASWLSKRLVKPACLNKNDVFFVDLLLCALCLSGVSESVGQVINS